MSEAVIAHWEVTRAKNAGQKPNPHGGQFDKFYVGLKNLDGGADCDDAYWQRKAPSTVDVGDHVFGKLEEGEYGFRFYLEKDEEAGSPRSSRPSESSTASKSSGETNWTERNAEIRRQHSQEMAILWWTSPLAKAATLDKDQIARADFRPALKEWADWFDQDAIAAGQKASQGAGAGTTEGGSPTPSSVHPTSTPPPEKSSADDTGEWLENLLIQGGASTYGAGTLAAFATEEFSPENLKKCEALLSNLDSQVEGRKRLETSYTKAKGEPVPQEDPDEDSIPFHHPEYREFGSERLRWRF